MSDTVEMKFGELTVRQLDAICSASTCTDCTCYNATTGTCFSQINWHDNIDKVITVPKEILDAGKDGLIWNVKL